MRACKICNLTFGDDKKFCKHCGNPLEGSGAGGNSQAVPPEPPPAARNTQKASKGSPEIAFQSFKAPKSSEEDLIFNRLLLVGGLIVAMLILLGLCSR